MKSFISKCLFLLALLVAAIGKAGAEDIDVYAGNSGTAQPNLLVVVDNSGAWSASSPTNDGAANGCPAGVLQNSMKDSSGGVEACGFYRAVTDIANTPSLVGKIRLGLMMFVRQNIQGGELHVPAIPPPATPTAAQAELPLMTAGAGGGIETIQNKIKSLEGSGPTNNTANGTDVGGAMQEAWAYYTGNTGMSGTKYPGLSNAAVCGKKFVLFIGISRVSSDPADSNANNVFDQLRTAVGGDAAEQAKYLPYVQWDPAVDTKYMKDNNYWADEWTRFNNLRHEIVTYTITLVDENNPNPDYERFMKSMADEGGGLNFRVNLGDMDALVQALLRIFNEVQAVDSVFASASLPISANAQGTFLNQVYMGMFRPDSLGRPRWLGNLKQYRFGVDANKNLYLGDGTTLDAAGVAAADARGIPDLVVGQPGPAISSSGSGFIDPQAVSFWSSKDTAVPPTVLPDSIGGFWRRSPDDVAAGFDSPDGDIVERGGAGQQIRIENLTVDYVASPAGPRRLFTCVGASCSGGNALSLMPFATNNADLTAAALGISNPSYTASVSTFSRDSGTKRVTITHAAATPAITNATTVIGNGSSNGQYNHALTNLSPTIVNATTITYALPAETPPVTPQTPTSYTATGLAAISGQVSNVSSLTRASNAGRITVTADLADPTFGGGSPVAINDVITIANSSGYNGSGYTVTNVSGNTVTFTMSDSPSVYGGGGDIWVGASCQKTGPAAGRNCDGIGASNTNDPATAPLPGLVRGTNTSLSATSHILMVNFTAGAGGSTITVFGVGATAKMQGATSSLYDSTAGYTIKAVGIDCRVDVVDPTTGTTRQYVGTASSATKVYSLCLDLGTTGSGYVNSPSLTGNGATVGTTTATRTTGTVQAAVSTMTRGDATCPASNLATVTVNTTVAHGFSNGETVAIGSSALGPDEAAYIGSFTISTAGPASNTFTYQVPTAPACTDNTAGMTITYQDAAGGIDPKDLIRWVRGADNIGDEKSPGGGINIRPSVHGDVLHSRPAVINYGSPTGVVVFYGANDGVFRAINGNQTASMTTAASPGPGTVTVPPGGELWSFVVPEFYPRLQRLYSNSPVIKLSNTSPDIVPTPTPRDYFFDGGTGVYQDADSGKTYLFLSARRGGRLIYALDVSDPTTPKFLWKKGCPNLGDNTGCDASFEELGQTWSTPKVALVRGHVDALGKPAPVVIFGAGYDPDVEDIDLANTTITANTATSITTVTGAVTTTISRRMGRGVYVLDATTGTLLWSAGGSNSTGTFTTTVSGMDYAIPSDVTFLDRSPDGFIDRLYVPDLGGNVWRVDLEPAGCTTAPTDCAPSTWQVTKLAALGGAAGDTTKRKIFFPPDVVATTNFDAVLVGTGDREHPTLASAQASNIVDRFYMLKDLNTGPSAAGWTAIVDNSSSTTEATTADLFDATTTTFDQTSAFKGFYLILNNVVTADSPKTGEVGEKIVNAPTTVGGRTFFGTNTPQAPAAGVCKPNLGIARGYSVDFVTGSVRFSEFAGGGLPPSPVTGLVSVDLDGDGKQELVPFLIGGDCPAGTGGPDCSPLGAQKPPIPIEPTRARVYWYREHDK